MRARIYIAAALFVVSLLAAHGCSESPTTPVRCRPNPYFVAPLDDCPTWSPDGRRIAYVHGDVIRKIYLVDTTGTAPVRIMDGDYFGPVELSWSPDGSRIAMLFQDEIWTLSVADRSLRKWTSIGDRYPHWPTWSSDGRYIFYSIISGRYGQPDSTWGLHVIDTVDASQRAFLHDGQATFAGSPARWSPDGQTVLFINTVTQGKTFEVFSLQADGSNYRQRTHLNGSANNPQWSADGQLIFFDFAPEQCPPGHSLNRNTWVMRPDGSELRQWPVNLGNPRVQFGYPFQLSRDGMHVAFVDRDSSGRYGVIHMMRIDGTGRKQLTFPPDSLSSSARDRSSLGAHSGGFAAARTLGPIDSSH